jgi:DNA-binding XRE family transcriptional regulator
VGPFYAAEYSGITIKDLAKKVGVHDNTIYQIEHGKLKPSTGLEVRLRDALSLESR